jgi:hypothetical protein
MYIERDIEKKINKYLSKPEILAIIGPRQSGKTTLLRKIQSELPKSIFITFEDREELELFDQSPKLFIQKYQGYRYIFIDEFQYARYGGKNLKLIFDTQPKIKIIISGSSAIDLTVKAVKFLVGRIIVFELFCLSWPEFIRHRNPDLFNIYQRANKLFYANRSQKIAKYISEPISTQFNSLLEEYIKWGGYPRVVSAGNNEEKQTILKNIYNTYFLRDIKDALGLLDEYKLAKLIKILAIQAGQLIEYNQLSQDTEYDFVALKKYLNILEKTYICQTIKPFFRNKQKEIVKNPKIYFFDNGLKNYILNNFNNLDQRADQGFMWENFVFNRFWQQSYSINFWRTKTKQEVDFLVNFKDILVPIECKSTISQSNPAKNLHKLMSEYQLDTGYVLNKTKYEQKINTKTNQIYYLPYWII